MAHILVTLALSLFIAVVAGLNAANKLPENCGKATGTAQDPWIVSISYQENPTRWKHWTEGTAISKRYVLTKGDVPSQKLSVKLKPHGYTRIHLSATRKDFTISPGGEIALLRLDKDYSFDDYFQPICLPVSQSLRTSWPKQLTSYIKVGDRIEKPSMSEGVSSKCSSSPGTDELCMVPKEGTTCADTTGTQLYAPASLNGDQRMVLYGLAVTPGCKTGAHVFKKVASHVDWIVDNIKE
uniref:Putative trypsin-like serine protease n=1 Tax=Culex tarsalis TaxID=7177 RepID=A0A1Q3FPK9_CULTA